MISEPIKRILSSIILIPVIFFIIIQGSYLFNLLILFVLILALYEWYKMTKKKKYNLFGYFFIFFAFFSVFQIRNNNDENSLSTFFFILLICISTDIGGYIFGKLFKGPRLTKISPNKTYSGVIGAYILSFLILIIVYNYLKINFLNQINLGLKEVPLILLISTISQLGDILISYCKRLSNMKNSGNLIPGHGGILDRIDGMIFAFPFYYLIQFFIKII